VLPGGVNYAAPRRASEKVGSHPVTTDSKHCGRVADTSKQQSTKGHHLRELERRVVVPARHVTALRLLMRRLASHGNSHRIKSTSLVVGVVSASVRIEQYSPYSRPSSHRVRQLAIKQLSEQPTSILASVQTVDHGAVPELRIGSGMLDDRNCLVWPIPDAARREPENTLLHRIARGHLATDPSAGTAQNRVRGILSFGC